MNELKYTHTCMALLLHILPTMVSCTLTWGYMLLICCNQMKSLLWQVAALYITFVYELYFSFCIMDRCLIDELMDKKNCVLNMAEVVNRPIRYLQSFKNTARTSVLRRTRLFAAELAKMVDMWRFLENSHSTASKTHKFLFIYCTMVLPWRERLHKNLVILWYTINIMLVLSELYHRCINDASIVSKDHHRIDRTTAPPTQTVLVTLCSTVVLYLWMCHAGVQHHHVLLACLFLIQPI